jgi:hypothetical protein
LHFLAVLFRVANSLLMIFCAGLERLSREGKGWANCPREAIRGDRFCAAHRDALDGAFLGLLRQGKSLHAIQILFEEAAEAMHNARRKERWHRARARRTEKRRLKLAAKATEAEKNTASPDVPAAAPETS